MPLPFCIGNSIFCSKLDVTWDFSVVVGIEESLVLLGGKETLENFGGRGENAFKAPLQEAGCC